ncbi:hypothetical protein LTR70_005764 [Exophiala xenobiotica]|uniref:Uncharacterized protein n=1 Tax=Lithohypha guttulata TaxID=1690604 RepID=A0ABR0K8W1_9EURO|nr:hypothetical protein LTR24_005501 [Lithohypha guttulata]KAK5317658.1 hypothetical protein LTR70_005764 [Exophiala xenobiotica]
MPHLGILINSNMIWLCLYCPLFIAYCSSACFFTVFTQFCHIAEEEGNHAAQAAPSSAIQKDAIKHRPYLTLPLPAGIVFTPFEIYLFHRATNLTAVHAIQGMWEKQFSGMYMLVWSYFFISFLATTVGSVENMRDNWPQKTWDRKWAGRVERLVDMVVRFSLASIIVPWSNYLNA